MDVTENRPVRKISISLPAALIDEIKQISPNVSSFLAVAAREHLRREILKRGLEQGYGAWSDVGHPDLRTLEDIEAYVATTRANWPSGDRDQ